MPTVTTSVPAPPAKHQKAARHRKAPIARRRAAKNDHEEDDASVATEESFSDDEDSPLSGNEEYSDESEEDDEEDEHEHEVTASAGTPKPQTDTEAMRNGMQGDDDAEEVDFENMGEEKPTNGHGGKVVELAVRDSGPATAVKAEGTVEEKSGPKPQETLAERKRREHEEYKARREADPAFVPNRGQFFMHDHRDSGPGSNGFRPFGRGRGRGRGDINPIPEPTESRWEHDLHHQQEADPAQVPQATRSRPVQSYGYTANSFAAGRQRGPDQPRSFGNTMQRGNINMQVKLPEMKAPITFANFPLRAYTRLPYHRPPLRRDKPVRIAIPEAPVRYIYPVIHRSFIFIPRNLRPGGSGYIRGVGQRGRGGGFAAARSIYGPSTYSPSVAASRRSSGAFDQRFQSPAQSITSQRPAPPRSVAHSVHGDEKGARSVVNGEAEERPVVRLPSGQAAPQQMAPPQQAPTPQHPPPSYTPSVASAAPYRNATPHLPMQQPHPQKPVNIAKIDSPQFQHQYSGPIYTGSNMMDPIPYTHSRHPSYHSQPSGTPLQDPRYQSYAPPPPPHHYQPHPQPHYYPVPAQHHYPPPPPYAGPSPMPNGAAAPPPPAQPTYPPQTVAHESNGMVYYYPANEAPPQAQHQGPPPPPATYYSQPGYQYPTTGMPITPGPEVPPQPYYYPPNGYYA